MMMSATDLGANNAQGGATRIAGAVVRPTQVTEKSLLESVAGFINEVQAGTITPGTTGQGGPGTGGPGQGINKNDNDPRVNVTWARFDVADVNDRKLFPEGTEINGNSPPLLLVLGYTHGVQIWLLPMNGEAQEILSWKQGVVKTLRVLPSPENSFGCPDNFAHCRPLIALVDATGPATAFSSASFISLKTGEQVHNIKFNSEIADLMVNRRVVVTTFKEKLAVFDACSLEARFTITSCYPSPGVVVNPVALGDRWLAYADQKLVPLHRSFGGLETDCSQSMAAWGINVGSKLAQGVSKIYSNFFSTSAPSSLSHRGSSMPHSPSQRDGSSNEPQKGVVTVLDIMKVYKTDRDEVNIADKVDGVVAHFIAHNKAIVALQFDHTGSLLLTCDRVGNYFNLFRIVPHPAGSSCTAVHHLYALYRGDTPGSVQDVAFSPDSRWVSVSTLRGTTHLFPVTPYGGPIGVRTHTSSRVVNRLSRFHRSAGINDYKTGSSSGRNSPNPNMGTSPKVGSYEGSFGSGNVTASPIVVPYPNPHIPPFPSPTLVQPTAQLRQPYIVSLTNQTIGSATSVGRKKSFSSSSGPSSSHGSGSGSDDHMIPIRLATTFAPSRAWLVGGQHGVFSRGQHKKAHDALYVMANHGVLLEYSLDVIPDSTLPKEKICESSPIDLIVTPFGQWSLPQPRDRAELQPPLPQDNPLMLPSHALQYAGNPYKGSKESLNENEDDKWLSQVEIVTHLGPHRRLWMGPQFAFKTFQKDGERDLLVDLDISLPSRPEQSTPVNMPPISTEKERQGRVPVLIEACSASSYELSPHLFSNAFAPSGPTKQSKGQNPIHDLESELQEAMSETVISEESLIGGPSSSRKYRQGKVESSEEEFFCLTPEDSRSLSSSTSTSRSRNASATSVPPVQMTLPETKIFSVAVEAKKSEETKTDRMKIGEVEAEFSSGRIAVYSEDMKKEKKKKKGKEKEKLNLKSADTREVSPKKEENVDLLEEVCFVEAKKSSQVEKLASIGDVVIKKEKCLKDDDNSSDAKEEDLSTHSDEFMEITNRKADTDEEDEEETFVIKEDEEEEEEESTKKGPSKSCWAKELFKKEDKGEEIIRGIQKAENKWEKGDINKSSSTGFNLDLLMSSGKSPSTASSVIDDSEDDFDFKPAYSGKKKSRNQKSARASTGSYADSESSFNMEEKKEGWSFEADDLDVNLLINDMVNTNEVKVDEKKEDGEKTALEDVFKFDAELAAEEDDDEDDDEEEFKDAKSRKNLSLEDLHDAINDTTDDSESDYGCGKRKGNKMSTSLNVTFDEVKGKKDNFGSTSESSVGNSPNPKKNKGKKKNKKNKKNF